MYNTELCTYISICTFMQPHWRPLHPTVFMGLATGLVLCTAVVTSRSAYHSVALSFATDGVTCSR